MPGFRRLKSDLADLLASPSWRTALSALPNGPRELTGPLLSLLLHKDELVRWRAAEALGLVLARLAEADLPAAREVVRMLLWRLNEESGNMGWGAGEALGAALAADGRLATEYARILCSYVQHKGTVCHGNFLDNVRLRHGVYWGVARLAQARPEAVRPMAADLLAVLAQTATDADALECHDAQSRGLACLALGLLGDRQAQGALEARQDDPGAVRLYWDDALADTTVGRLARQALLTMAQGAS